MPPATMSTRAHSKQWGDRPRPASAPRRRTARVAEGIVRLSLRAALRSIGLSGRAWVRFPPAAFLLVALLVFIFVLARGGASASSSSADAAAAARTSLQAAEKLGVGGSWPLIPPGRRRHIRTAGCCWLLVSCLLSGDIQPNPGPADRLRTLQVYCQNVCSLKNKLGTLRSHAGELAGYDAVCLTETWLGPHVSDA